MGPFHGKREQTKLFLSSLPKRPNARDDVIVHAGGDDKLPVREKWKTLGTDFVPLLELLEA